MGQVLVKVDINSREKEDCGPCSCFICSINIALCEMGIIGLKRTVTSINKIPTQER